MSRICLLTDSPEPSGLGTHMLVLADGLRQHEITVAAPAGSPLLARAAAGGHFVKAIDADETALARWLERLQPDVLHVHAGIGWEGHAAIRAARVAGVPTVRTEHLPYLLTEDGQRREHQLECQQVDALICVSEAVARSHAEAGIDRALIRTIPNGVTALEASGSREALRAQWGLDSAPVLLMAARFSPQKRHGLLLDALPAILGRFPRCTVLLAGDGPLLGQIAREVHARGLAGSVRMFGARQDVTDLLTLADLVVLPSAFEGLSMVALEAMAAGRAIVVCDAPGNDEAIVDGVTGRLAPSDAQGLSHAINALLGDHDALAALRGGGTGTPAAAFHGGPHGRRHP